MWKPEGITNLEHFRTRSWLYLEPSLVIIYLVERFILNLWLEKCITFLFIFLVCWLLWLNLTSILTYRSCSEKLKSLFTLLNLHSSRAISKKRRLRRQNSVLKKSCVAVVTYLFIHAHELFVFVRNSGRILWKGAMKRRRLYVWHGWVDQTFTFGS